MIFTFQLECMSFVGVTQFCVFENICGGVSSEGCLKFKPSVIVGLDFKS